MTSPKAHVQTQRRVLVASCRDSDVTDWRDVHGSSFGSPTDV
jgi:hypothetical protein